jgi:regulator of protease activity HflC (stomatin/prohibitin superfamily)
VRRCDNSVSIDRHYVSVLLQPQFRSVAREVTARFEARSLYTSERERLATSKAAELRKLVEPRGLAIESTPLRKLPWPPRSRRSSEPNRRASACSSCCRAGSGKDGLPLILGNP